MKLTFRMLMLGVAVVGLGFGASFAAGVAYGQGNPKTVNTGLTQQQIASLLGTSALTNAAAGGGATGGAGASSTATAGGARPGAAGAGGAAQLLGRSVTGRITAIDGRTLTIETATGSQKVNLAQNATLERVTTASTSDFKVGDTILASGTRNNDGSFDASNLTQVPQGLQGLLGGGTAPAAAPTTTSR